MDNLFFLIIGASIGYAISYFMFAITEIVISRQVEKDMEKYKKDKDKENANE